MNYPNTASNQVGSAVRRVRRHVKMPERNTTLDNWKNNQLSIGCDSLDAKITNEIEEKERGTIWSGLRRAKAQEKHLTK